MVACALLGYDLGKTGLAQAYIDPVAHIRAQDEAVYASTSLHMAEQGGWLTPMLLGRYAFYKPPLLYWVSGFAARCFRGSEWALRLPSLLAAAAIVTILFGWIWRDQSLLRAAAACALLISDRLFHTLAHLALTDMLVVLWIVIAMAAVHSDPALERRRSLWIFGAAVGLAILTKSLAGLLPLMMLAGSRAGVRRFVQVCGIAALVAAPWHVYQLIVHTRWFWAEYVLTENFKWAVAAPSQSTAENPLLYYPKRLALGNPALCVAALLGIPAAIRARDRLLAAWVCVVLLALFAFGYHNTSYLLMLIPALCLLAARAPWPVAFMACAMLWFPMPDPPPLPSVPELKAYAALHRPNDLIIVSPEDQFVSATLPIRHVHYVFFNAHPDAVRLPLDFRYLGISMTVDEYNSPERTIYQRRLAEFGLPSLAPIATQIIAQNADDVRALMAAHPEADFSLPAGWDGAPQRVMLLAH